MLLSNSDYQALLIRDGPAGLYMDPVLARSRKQYLGFIKDLHKSKAVSFLFDFVDECGVFFVFKKAP